MPRLQAQEGAPESTKLGGEGDPINISDGFGDGPQSMGDRVVDKGAEIPQVEGQTPWPTGLRAIEVEKKKNEEEQKRKEEEEEKKHQLEQWRQQQLEEQLEQQRQQELLELQLQQQWQQQQLEEQLEQLRQQGLHERQLQQQQPWLEEGQRLKMGEEELPVYGPTTPPWLRPGGFPPSKLSHVGRTVSWRWRSACARPRIQARRRGPSMALRGLPWAI